MYNTISMIGLGYIGLPTATLFASKNKQVIGIDVVPEVVETINQGKIHIIEPDLDGLVHKVVAEGYLRASTKPQPADAFLIAVPTPFMDGFKPDVSYVESAAKAIAPVLRKGNLVVLESTSPVGTTEMLAAWLAEARPDLSFPQSAGNDADVQVAYCPERVLPGKVLQELVMNDRVIGGMSYKASQMAIDLYRTFVQGECLVTNARTAEMCKLTENSFRDVNIAFANELSMISAKLDINVWELIRLANHHPRVNILQPGAGVGGHCIAVDPWFIVDKTPDEARLIRTAREVNDHKPHWVLNEVRAKLDELHAAQPNKARKDMRIACLGLSFKPDIDDLRESPAVEIVKEITKLGCQVQVVEPHIGELPASLTTTNVSLVAIEDAAVNADVLCILVKHSAFTELRKALTHQPALVDAVGLLVEKRAFIERRSGANN
jgi:UDP-N-acetyl-D-mannosaminuronic acid dehydrogenase